jgi:hypothetical protein
VNSSVPEAYGRIVLRLLEKRPEDRYQSAAELVSDIRQALGAGTARPPESVAPRPEPVVMPVAAPPQEAALQPERVSSRTIPIAIAGLVLLAVAAVVVFLATRTGKQSPEVPKGAVVARNSGIETVGEAVTNTAYKAFCDQTGHPYPNPLPSDPNYFYARPDAPVLNVTYRDAAAFARWAGKRLPSASEWDQLHGGDSEAEGSVEWTSTPFTPSPADAEAFRKLAGAEPRGDWFIVKGSAPLAGLPSEPLPRSVAIGFRCVKSAAP